MMRKAFLLVHKNSSLEEKALAHFISDDFSKNVVDDYEYMFSATLTSEIIADMGFDGVVYPSVRLSGQAGLNIALKPSVADTKLDFIQVVEQVLYKNKDHSINRIENVTPKGQTTKAQIQFPDGIILKQLGIISLEDLPIRE